MYAQPRDINELRRLLAMGVIPDDQPIRGSLGPGQAPDPQVNELARILSDQEQFAQGGGEGPLPMGSMRNEQTGAVTYFKPGGGGFSRQPYQQQAAPQPRAKVRVVGAGLDGSMTDLGEEDARALPIDNTRPGIEIPGLGKGRYTADGRYAVIANPDGSQTKVVLGYDRAASERGQVRNMKMREMELNNAMREEQIGAIQDRRQMLAAGPQRTMTDAGPAAGGVSPQAKMTESQAKALAFGMRAANSSEILDLVGKSGEIQPNLLKRGLEGFPLIGESLGTMANAIPDALGGPSAEQQQVEQAQRDFINAVLRRESGAVISDGEFANARQQYFPQPGDSPEVIKQKRRNRQLAIEGFSQEADPVRPGLIKSAGERARTMFEARSAIREGAPRESVVQRLRQMGIDEEP